jgi:hypothetical protein
VAKQIAKTDTVLLFDSNALVLNSVFSEIQTAHQCQCRNDDPLTPVGRLM